MKHNLKTWFPLAATALFLAGCGLSQNHAEQFDFQNETANTSASSKHSAETDKNLEKTPEATQETVVIGHTYIPNVQFAPSYLAKEKAIFSANLDVQLRHHGPDEGLFTALLAGEENLVIASADEMLQARSNGLDLVAVGSYYAKNPVKLIVKADSTINSVADLKGKTVALPGEYGANWFALQAGLKEANLSKNDLRILSVGYTQLAALRTGQADAVIGFSNNDSVQFKLAGEKIREIDLTKEQLPLVSASIITTGEYAKTHKTQLKQALQGLKLGMQRTVDDPQAALTATRAYDPNLQGDAAEKSALETLQATNQLLAPTGRVDLTQDIKAWELMNDYLSSLPGVLGSKVRLETAVTNDYL